MNKKLLIEIIIIIAITIEILAVIFYSRKEITFDEIFI
jgi:hypothetical protein